MAKQKRVQASKRLRENRQSWGPVTKKNRDLNAVKQVVSLVEGSCPSGKLRYGTQQAAQKALTIAQRNRAAVGKAHVERRFYGGPDDPCPRRCGGYHLTSRERYGRPA